MVIVPESEHKTMLSPTVLTLLEVAKFVVVLATIATFGCATGSIVHPPQGGRKQGGTGCWCPPTFNRPLCPL